ncbi:MAG: hypothetical protein ACRENP_21500 [Longimicrobiales bacterium]
MFRYLLAYAATTWVILQVVDQLANNAILPRLAYRASFAFFLSGLPGALIVAWFHGARGRQQGSRLELILLSVVAAFALTTTTFVVRADLGRTGSVRRAQLTPEDDPSRLAVLYFEPRGGSDAEFMAAGLTETLIDVLSRVKALHVVSRNGSQLFKGAAAPSDSIGRTLKVGTLVTGTVSQAGDRVRVHVRLTKAATGKQFNSTSMERPRSEIFALQDELADTVAVFLRKAIGAELGDLRLRMGTESVRAWELVQLSTQAAGGADVFVKSSDLTGASRALTEADSLLKQAETVDANWIEPVIRRGWLAYRQSRLVGMNRDGYVRWIDQGLQHADRALARDTASADARELRATLIYWRYLLNLVGSPADAIKLRDEAESGFRAAIAFDANRASALTSLSHLLQNKGELPEAKLKALLAYETDPFLENANLTIWRIFTSSWSLQDAIEARRYCQEGARRFPADFRFRQCQLMAYALPGDAPDLTNAWALVNEFAEQSPPQVRDVNRQRGYVYVAMGLARAGKTDSARVVLQKVRAGPDIDPVREVALLESIARTFMGDKEEAVRQLTVYFAASPGTLDGYRNDANRGQLIWYHQPLLEEPRFRSLVGLR